MGVTQGYLEIEGTRNVVQFDAHGGHPQFVSDHETGDEKNDWLKNDHQPSMFLMRQILGIATQKSIYNDVNFLY